MTKKQGSSAFAVEPIRAAKDILSIKNLLKDQPRDLLLYTMGINTWLPVSCLLKLKVRDVLYAQPGDGIRIGDKDVLYINRTIFGALQKYFQKVSPKEKEFLFVSRKGGKPLTASTVHSMVQKWAASVGLSGHYGAQSLRKTCGYHHWIDPEADHDCISQTFGHSSTSLTKRFLCINNGRKVNPKQVVVELDDVFLRNTGDPRLKKQSRESVSSEEAWITIMNLIAGQDADMFRLTDKYAVNVYASPSHFEHLGYTAEERIGKIGLDIVHPDDLDTMMQTLHELGLDPDDHQAIITYRVKHADGRDIWLETTFTYIADSDGDMKNLFQASRVVPKQKKAVGALIQKTKHQYFPSREVTGGTTKSKEKKAGGKDMVKMIPGDRTDMLRILDIKGRNIYVSPSHLEATGFTVEERINASNFEFIHPDDISVIISALNHAGRHRDGPQNVLLYYRVRHKEGHYIWVETLNEFVVEPDGNVNMLVQFSRLIPERKEAEACVTDLKIQHVARVYHEIVDWDKKKRLKILNIKTMSKKKTKE